MNQLFDVSGKVAVVTGINGNLGPIWAESLLMAGAKVAGIDVSQHGNKQIDELQSVYPGRFIFFQGDVRDRQGLESIKHSCMQKFGGVSILVNNAGIDQPPSESHSTYTLQALPLRQFYDVMEVNLTGAFLVSQIFSEYMMEIKQGSIVNIGSIYGSVSADKHLYSHMDCDPPFIKPPAYGASKAALINLTKYLSTHWAEYGIRVNSLSPGGVLANQDEKFKEKYTARVPMQRMAEKFDLMGPLQFLVSAASAYMTGQDLIVDGGFTVW